MMFEKIAPQVARDSEGRIVQVGDRYTMQYLDSELEVDMEVEFGPVTAIYPSKLIARGANGSPVELTTGQRGIILERIEEGLKCLGVRYKVY
jgi:hypothetical protein